MKEIKAYVRKSRIKAVVNALQAAQAPGVTVVEVHPVGYGYEPNYFEPRFEDSEKLVQVIRHEGHTGERGDGMIFVTDVSEAVRIRTGARGEQSLRAG